MRIYTKAGDLAFKTFTFPDGQPHFKLETYEREFQCVTIEMALKSPTDLFTLLLANDVLRQHGYAEVNLDVRYLMGARMDRAIDSQQPFTLQTVSRLVNGAGFSRVRLLDVHSDVATKLIRNSSNMLPFKVVEQVAASCPDSAIIIPDKGAVNRVMTLTGMGTGLTGRRLIHCSKVRDMATGTLDKFHAEVSEGRGRCYVPFEALIIDDICDGGRTFEGLARELRKKGATKVNLFVTHGVFSTGLPLEGIDKVFTTNSIIETYGGLLKRTDGTTCLGNTSVIIPISMKEL